MRTARLVRDEVGPAVEAVQHCCTPSPYKARRLQLEEHAAESQSASPRCSKSSDASLWEILTSCGFATRARAVLGFLCQRNSNYV